MPRVKKTAALFLAGGAAYVLIELLWRGRTHWTMEIVGGLCFLLIGGINEWFGWDLPLLLQGAVGAAAVTVLELISGVVLNLWLGLDVWDYSDVPFNLWGQVCLPFSLLWVLLAMVAVVLDDWLRYWLFGEERPHYTLV